MEVARSWRRRPRGDPRCPTSRGLTSLLDDERFLLVVFEHLVDYGLKECRLVCRTWRETCKHFPVELKSVNSEQLRKIGAFPNTTALTVNHCRRTMSDVELFEHLASLSKLKSLTFDEDFVFLGESAEPYIQSITRLTDLTIQFPFPHPTEDALASLNQLTNLTKLVLRWTQWKPQMDPLVELQNIQSLEIEAYTLFGEGSTCMFPSLSNLTHLKLTDNLMWGNAPEHSLEEITIFAGSLLHLSLHLGPHWTAVNFTPFTSLRNLGTLGFDRACGRCRGFVQVLPQLRKVTKLQSLAASFVTDSALEESISRCSALKALHWSRVFLSPDKSRFMRTLFKNAQLTELSSTFYCDLPPELCCLTLLECLHLNVEFKNDCSLDQVLSCMPNLQTLEVSFQDTSARLRGNGAGRLRLSGDVFYEMENLRSVSLHRVDVGESFFQVLASRTGLTRLEFTSSDRQPSTRGFMRQVNLLRNLEVLKFRLSKKNVACSLLSPDNLPKLRRLNIRGDVGQIAAVRRKFHRSMHPVQVNAEISPWRSPFHA